MKKSLFLFVTILTSSLAFSQTYLNFSPALAGEYKIDGRPVYCTVSEAPEVKHDEAANEEAGMEAEHAEYTKNREQFLLKYNKKSVEGRPVRSSEDDFCRTAGEWYRVGRTYGRFVLTENGEVNYQQGRDDNHDKIIEPTRTYVFPGKVEKSDLSIYEGATNEELVEEKMAEKKEGIDCEQAEQKLRSKYMMGQAPMRFKFKDEVLYLVSDKPGENADYEGVLTKVSENGTEKITHKARFSWQEKTEVYIPVLEKLDCGVTVGVEQPSFEIDRMKKFVILGGKKFLKD